MVTTAQRLLVCSALLVGLLKAYDASGQQHAEQPVEVVVPTPTAINTPIPGCVPEIKSGTVKFEEFSEGASGVALSQALLKDYGITITSSAGGFPRVVEVTKEGDAEAAIRGWASLLCPGRPNYNRLCNGGDGGVRILSLSETMDTKSVNFTLEFVQGVSSANFDLADVDGNEVYTIKALDKDGNEIGSAQVQESGYNLDSTGNSALMNFKVSSSGALIKTVQINGSKSINIFGVGIDNISTGLVPCGNQ